MRRVVVHSTYKSETDQVVGEEWFAIGISEVGDAPFFEDEEISESVDKDIDPNLFEPAEEIETVEEAIEEINYATMEQEHWELNETGKALPYEVVDEALKNDPWGFVNTYKA